MSNSNYVAGRAFEYETMKRWKVKGYDVLRTAGSHGKFDVVAVRPDRKPELIQCKRCSDKSEAEGLIRTFLEETPPSRYYHQVIEVKIKGQRAIMGVTV